MQDILENLVSIPSITSDTGQCEAVVDYVSDQLNPKVFNVKKGQFNSFPYILATTQKPDKNTAWFVTHLDVVPGPKDLFKLRENNDKYFGRGVLDMKGIAAAELAAVNDSATKDSNIGLMFTTDEEVGGKDGVGELATNNLKGAAAFVFDQSSNWVLQEKMKGVLWLHIHSQGIAAHGARPWLGRNANDQLVDFLGEFRKDFRSGLDTGPGDNYHTTYNIGRIRGGGAVNQVSESAEAIIDIRYISNQDKRKVVKRAARIASHIEGLDVDVPIDEPLVNSDTSDPWFIKTKKLINDLGIKVGPDGERFGHGSHDGRYLSDIGISVVTTRPPGGEQHAKGEWVSKKGLNDLKRLCEAIINSNTRS